MRLQAGIREWLLRSARPGRHGLNGAAAPAVLTRLCAAAFAPTLAEAAELGGDKAAARIGVLSSVGATTLGGLVAAAVDRVRSAHAPDGPSRGELQRAVSQTLLEALAGTDQRAAEARSDIAMVLREIDAGGTVFRAAIEAGDEDLEREVLLAVEAVSAEFGEMEFLLADLARAAEETQDSLGAHGAELRAAAGQVARQSADVRVIREEIAVITQRSRQWAGAGEPVPDRPRWTGGCPYRGLLPYGPADEAVFFGREQLTAALAGTLAQAGLVMVTGAAGAGKTSLLQAGLGPALARGVQVPGSPSWPRLAMRAGSRPLAELAGQLAALAASDPAAIRRRLAEAPGRAHLVLSEIAEQAGAARLVLIVDQFEQAFAADDEDARQERAAFIDAVHAAATRPAGPRAEPPLLAVIAVRGDFWDRCAAYPQLIPAMERDQIVVGPMTEAELRRAITGPAQAGGLAVEPDLAEALLAELRPAQGVTLPLVSAVMTMLWEHRRGDALTRQDYQDAGAGIAEAVAASAEAAYLGLEEDQQALAPEVFRRLTATGPDGRPVRRAVSAAELRAGRPAGEQPGISAVVDAFARHRLLTLDADRCEIPQDVLIEAWPRLRRWLAEDQASAILHGQLAEGAARWRGSDRDRGLLYRGVQLAATSEAARAWAADPGRYPALGPGEAEFLRASGSAATRARRRRRALAAVTAAAVLAALAGAGIAVRSARATAARQDTQNTAQRLAAQSTALDAADPVTAALLAGAAWRLDPTAQARYSLVQSLAQPVRGVLTAPSGALTALAYSPDGRELAAGYSGGTIRLWDLAGHRTIGVTSFGAAPLALAFADGGQVLEAADASTVGTWTLAGHAAITRRPLAGAVQAGPVTFSPDGSTVASGGADGGIRLWSAATGREIGAPMSSDDTALDVVTFSPDGTLLAAAADDGNVQLWSVASQQVTGAALIPNGPAVSALAFSPDGQLLATGGRDGTARLWNVADRGTAGAVMVTGEPVSALAFGAGGSTLAAAQSNGVTELWDVTTQAQTGTALAVPGSAGVSALAAAPRGAALATGNGNGSIQLWDTAGFHQASSPLPVGTVSPGAAFSAGGGLLAAGDGHGHGTLQVWDVAARRQAGPAVSAAGTVAGLALSPDGKTVAVAGDGVQLWQTATGQRAGAAIPAAGRASYQAVAFSPDGKTLATLGTDGTARLWDVATGRPDGTPMTASRPGPLAGHVAFSPDGKTLVTVVAGGRAQLWSVTTHRPSGQPMVAGPATTATFSPDGRTLATTGGDGSTRLWDVATQQQIGTPMTAGAQPVYAAVFSPDGKILATTGGDGSTRLWDVATQQQIGTPMTADGQPVYAAAFSSDGSSLATVSSDGTARRWTVAFPADLAKAACGIADVTLTRQQWAGYAGNQPYQQVCPAGSR